MDSDAFFAMRFLRTTEKQEMSEEERALIEAHLKALQDKLEAIAAEMVKRRKPSKPVSDPFQIPQN